MSTEEQETPYYITPSGYRELQKEALDLVNKERPATVNIVSWAAGNGDRSENGDYIYGKKKLREIDKRIRYITSRLKRAKVIDPSDQLNTEKVFFGATVTLQDINNPLKQQKFTIIGVDEAKPDKGYISWVSPLAQAVLGKELNDCIQIKLPQQTTEDYEILDIQYESLLS